MGSLGKMVTLQRSGCIEWMHTKLVVWQRQAPARWKVEVLFMNESRRQSTLSLIV